MPRLDTNRRVSIDVAGDTVTFICRTPTDAEQSKFLNSRFTTKRNKVETRVYAARAEFMDLITVDVEGVTFVNAEGVELALNASTSLTDADKTKWTGVLGVPVKSFRELIPLAWKSSAAQRFEDSNNSGAEDEDEPAKN